MPSTVNKGTAELVNQLGTKKSREKHTMDDKANMKCIKKRGEPKEEEKNNKKPQKKTTILPFLFLRVLQRYDSSMANK